MINSIRTDHRINCLHHLKWWFDILRSYRARNLADAESEIILHKNLSAILETSFGPRPGRLKILEIGCGQRATQTILFTTDGHETVGIDVEVPTFRMTWRVLSQVVKENGWERAFKSVFRHWLFDGQFLRRLSSRYGKTLVLDQVDIRLMSATHLEFPDDYFDFLYSSLVFEHIDNVPAAVREVNRVLKPEGLAWINIHLFPSLSGGHQPEWANRGNFSCAHIPPWDHLLDNKYPAYTYLNKLRWADYRKILNQYLVVMEERPQPESITVLTPRLEELLLAKGYAREDLITREVAFLCRKKGDVNSKKEE